MHYLSFDCATKTFAFSCGRIALPSLERLEQVRKASQQLAELAKRHADSSQPQSLRLVHEMSAALRRETDRWFSVCDGDTVDLVPGRSNADIPMSERVRAVVRYVESHVRPAVEKMLSRKSQVTAIAPAPEAMTAPAQEAATAPAQEATTALAPLKVFVEYQMGPNHKAQAVAVALLTLFAECDTVLVNPSLKNSVAVCAHGRYSNFASRYATSYGANKAHCAYNFARLEQAFPSGVAPALSKSLRGHIADSVMQVVAMEATGAAPVR